MGEVEGGKYCKKMPLSPGKKLFLCPAKCYNKPMDSRGASCPTFEKIMLGS